MSTPTQTALIVIDVQESFRQRPDDWAATANPQVIDNVARLVDDARRRGDTVVWVTHAEPGTDNVFDPARGFVRVVDELAPLDDELQLTKTSINAFTTTNLQQQLVLRGVRRVVVCGIRTEQCCETTARLASDLGFEVDFVLDATTTSGILAGADYGDVAGADLMSRTASVLGARGFASITSTAARTSAV